MTISMIKLIAATALTTLAGFAPASADPLQSVPRNRTLISQGWDFYNQVPSNDNFNPYAGVLLHQRNSLHYTVNEELFYTNHNTNELIPWQAESYSYNSDFTELTIKLRNGVKWSDGEPFTADDVVFTFNMLKGAAPDLLFSSQIAEWVDSATATDPLTVTIKLKKPGPRWARDFLATGQSTRFVVVPEHIWKRKDPKTFADFDLAKGWPVGTGPYKLVKSDANSLFYDLRDKWWALDTGLVKQMPAVQRVIYVPATVEAMPQLFATNQIDMGRSIGSGQFEAIKAQNPNLIAWNKEGPLWGAADGCIYAIRFNHQKPPFDNVDLHHAVNAALDRDQLVNLAYEGSMNKAILPISSYSGMRPYADQMAKVDGVADIEKHSPELVEKYMTAGGFKKGPDGKWANGDGTPFQIELLVSQGDPSGPVLSQQLQNAGFDEILNVQQKTALYDSMMAGNYAMTMGPHCGSLYDPWQTFEHFHSKYIAPVGKTGPNLRAVTRYNNPKMDDILNKMEKMAPSPDDPTYMDLVKQATAIFARDLPEISLIEETQTTVFNTTYWKGWPTAEDPYISPIVSFEGFARAVQSLQPTR